MTRHVALMTLIAAILVSSHDVRGQSPAGAAPAARLDYDIDYLGPPLPDPVMQHNKETYVSFGCAYCHGLTLIARGEAADLMHSALVGADVDGSTIVPLLKAGIPQTPKLSPMPQFADLSNQQLHAIARYIHYARQQGRYQEIVRGAPPAGDAAAGKGFFDQQCVSCHGAELNGIGRKYDEPALREQMLRPKSLAVTSSFAIAARADARLASARQRHESLLENNTSAQVANLIAYLRTR